MRSRNNALVDEYWREPVDEMRVKVYWNLHKKVFSVVALEGDRKGKVIQYADRIELKDVSFKVSEAGRQRVLRDRCKNVHAFVIGTRVVSDVGCYVTTETVSYNPYTRSQFYVRETGKDVSRSRWVSLHAERSEYCDEKAAESVPMGITAHLVGSSDSQSQSVTSSSSPAATRIMMTCVEAFVCA